MVRFSFSDQGSLCLVKVIVVNIVVRLFRIVFLVLNWGRCIVLSYLNFFIYLILLLQSLVAVQQTNSGGVCDQPWLPVPEPSFI